MSKVVIGIVGIKEFDDENTFLAKMQKKLRRYGDEADVSFEFITSEENGIAALARKYCTETQQKFSIYRADWDEQGNRAGYIRNEAIVDAVKELYVFWDGECPFLKEMIDHAMRFKKRVSIIFVKPTEYKARFDIDEKRVKTPKRLK